MAQHYKALSAIFPLILKQEESGTSILLHRRQNTGYQDGKWDIAGSGHVDENETAQMAVIRECQEEIGITVQMSDLTFVHLSHRLSKDRTYYDIYFVVNTNSGIPSIMEPEKCSALQWFPIHLLPSDIIECRKQDIEHYLQHIFYSEKREDLE